MGSTISIRFEKDFLDDLEDIMKDHRYSTKAEFIREAVRDKMKMLEKEVALKRLEKVYGSSKRKTTDKQLRKAREQVGKELMKKFGLDLE